MCLKETSPQSSCSQNNVPSDEMELRFPNTVSVCLGTSKRDSKILNQKMLNNLRPSQMEISVYLQLEYKIRKL